MESLEFLTSPLLSAIPDLIHGFGQRVPGSRAEAREAVRAVFRDPGEVFFLNQVHGKAVASPPWTEPPLADASVTRAAGEFLAIETADCLPILIVDRVGRQAAAAHAGWRGTFAGVAAEAVRGLVESGAEPGHLLAALGPSIGACCYEVGPEVEEAFGTDGACFFVPGPSDRKHLDLVAANRVRLEKAGLLSANIESLDLCTRCRPDLFFSYRRDGASAGRMISVIGFSRPAP